MKTLLDSDVNVANVSHAIAELVHQHADDLLLLFISMDSELGISSASCIGDELVIDDVEIPWPNDGEELKDYAARIEAAITEARAA